MRPLSLLCLQLKRRTQIQTLFFNEIFGCSPREVMRLLLKGVLHARQKIENTFSCK